jgi:DNA (cytosine-5)-methyltransferase 1
LDAHEYLLNHYQRFDFVWSSPPCPSHSKTNFFLNSQGVIRYPDMKLYQEIILLESFFKGKYVVENVRPYYKPLIFVLDKL